MPYEKTEKILIEDLVFLGAGSACFSISVFSTIIADFTIQIFVFMIGLALMCISGFDICRIMYGFKFPSFLKRLHHDKRGLVWVWIVGLVLTIPVCAFFYWVLDYPFDLIATQMASMYTFTGVMADAWLATQFIISYLLAFVLIMAVLWVIMNAKQPGVVY